MPKTAKKKGTDKKRGGKPDANLAGRKSATKHQVDRPPGWVHKQGKGNGVRVAAAKSK